MTIDEAIHNLNQAKEKGVGNIVLAWWEADAFGHKDDEKWAAICDEVERKMDWSHAHDDIAEAVRYVENNVL
jgi:hypothetical protein